MQALTVLKDHIVVGVMDGHGGDGAANYIKKHFVKVLENSKEWHQYVNHDPDKSPHNLGEALIAAFLELDDLLRAHQRGTKGVDNSGCTAVICVITPNHFVCANAGDSRCVLGSRHETIPLSMDHKPADVEETRRIVAAGGVVNW